MRYLTGLAVILLSSGLALADETPALDPAETVAALFDGMRAADAPAIRRLVDENAGLDRINEDGSVRFGSFEGWISWVDAQSPGDADEQIFDVVTHQHGKLATVWAPFVLDYKGARVGCGVNQFDLALRQSAQWIIVHGIDVADGGDCTTFRERYRPQ